MINVPFNRTRTRTTNKNNIYSYVAVGIGLGFRYRKRCQRYSCCCCSASSSSSVNIANNTLLQQKQEEENRGGVEYSSLKMLEWDKLCDSVSSFAATPFGRQAIQAQLWSLNRSYEESLSLQEETNAAVQMHNHGSCRLDFSPVDLLLVNSAIQHGRRGLPLYANEAAAVATMLEFADLLQFNLKAAIKENPDSYNRFMPLSQAIMELIINRPLVKSIRQVVDDDGSVKDSASSALKRSRNQVRMLETRLHQLMDSLIRNTMKDSFLEVSIVNGRWCIQLATDQAMSLKGLLLSGDSGTRSTVEPLSAVPLNDELQQARDSVKKAEADVLLMLTKKMQKDLYDIQKISDNIVQLDVINARATFGLSLGGVCPNLFLPEDRGRSSVPEACLSEKNNAKESDTIKREWILYMPKAYHPLLLQQYRKNLPKEIRRKQQGDNGSSKGEKGADIHSSDMQVSTLQDGHPVPVDIFIGQKTRVLVITGPNTGGKTICLKTVGLAAMMAKSGLHVLSSESVQIPWFDFIFADIGDEQSLSQSLSTFSGHLKQISDIRSQSTSQSLVLLDEVGAGTNPLEGAALGMSLLESFADGGASLTITTTHHGELKSLKYSNNAFENACMEFDEVNLKPRYKILWGVPGRSNAINISEKLGLPSTVVKNARKLYGAASAEINEVILDMEIFKQEFQELLHEAQHHLMISRNIHGRLLLARRKIMEHGADLQCRKLQEISKAAAVSRFALQQRLRQIRAYSAQSSQTSRTTMQKSLTSDSQSTTVSNYEDTVSSYNRDIATRSSSVVKMEKLPSAVSESKLPEIGDMVQVSSLGRKATVIRVDASKEEILVQAGNIKLKLKSTDIET